MSAPVGIEMETRHAPSRPFRLGTRRSRAAGREAGSRPPAAAQPGATRPRQRPASLDTDNQLATSDSEWLRSTLTEADMYRQQEALHRELLATYARIFEKYAQESEQDDDLRAWFERYHRASRPVSTEETPTARHKRVEKWLRENKPEGPNAEAIKWEKKWARLQHCQMEWIGYKAECCATKTDPIAVPIGCNDRLCPLCAWHRSQRARVKVKQLYDRLQHPVLITFTIPNLGSIRKKHIQHFRKMVRGWLAQNSRIDGGVYSVECTFNRKEKTWHLHAHALVNFSSELPHVDQKVDYFGQRVSLFTRIKWEWEFDWLNWSKDKWADYVPKVKMPARRKARALWRRAWDHWRDDFRNWTLEKRTHSIKWAKHWNPERRKYDPGPRADLTPAELAKYKQLERWNARHTRLIDIRPVRDRDGAVAEVLKYLTKAANFSDMPEAVEEFSRAVAGCRMIQTFGSWYGFELDTKFDPEHLDDWGSNECKCGLNMWTRIGVLFRRDVEMDSSGRWHLRRPHDHVCGGTVPRPTIRALEGHSRREGD